MSKVDGKTRKSMFPAMIVFLAFIAGCVAAFLFLLPWIAPR